MTSAHGPRPGSSNPVTPWNTIDGAPPEIARRGQSVQRSRWGHGRHRTSAPGRARAGRAVDVEDPALLRGQPEEVLGQRAGVPADAAPGLRPQPRVDRDAHLSANIIQFRFSLARLSVARPPRTAQGGNISLDPIGICGNLASGRAAAGPARHWSPARRRSGVMKTYRDLVAEAKRAVPEVTVEDVSRPPRAGASPSPSSTSGTRTSIGKGPSGAPCRSAAASSSSRSRRPSPTPRRRWCSTACPGSARSSPARCSTTSATRNVTSMAGGIRRWKELKLPLVKDQPLTAGPDGALQPPLHADAGGRARAEAAPPLEGAPDRRRRARLADRVLPRRGRRRDARHRRRRRRGPVEPPAPDPPPDAGRRPAEGRVRPGHHHGAQPRRDGGARTPSG